MNLSDFEAQLPAKILERGWDYFERDHIRRVERVGNQEYAALVRGTERYNVFVKLTDENIAQTECNCLTITAMSASTSLPYCFICNATSEINRAAPTKPILSRC